MMNYFISDLLAYLLLIIVLAAMVLATWVRLTKLPSLRSLSPGKTKRRALKKSSWSPSNGSMSWRNCHAKIQKYFFVRWG